MYQLDFAPSSNFERPAKLALSRAERPNAPFWARRRPNDFGAAPLKLAPTALLRRSPVSPSRMLLAPVEALIPPSAVTRLLAALAAPRPAHEAMQILRACAPLGDRRLLVGLQLLVELGALSLSAG